MRKSHLAVMLLAVAATLMGATVGVQIFRSPLVIGRADTSIEQSGDNLLFRDASHTSGVVLKNLEGAAPVAVGLVVQSSVDSPTTAVNIQADYILMRDAASPPNWTLFTSVNVTPDITADLDTGSENSSTWYYLYPYSTDGATVAGAYFSTSAADPTGLASGDERLRVCSVYNNSSSDLRQFALSGPQHKVEYQPDYFLVASGGPDSWTAVDISAYVPPQANIVVGTLSSADGGAVVSITGDPNSSTTTPYLKLQSSYPYSTPWQVNMVNTQTVYWYENVGNANQGVVLVSGWYEELY